MLCKSCPTPVPLVSTRLAAEIAGKIPPDKWIKVLIPAIGWLLEKHEGLSTYEGIHGRAYTQEEKVAIAEETAAVEGLPCPFVDGDGCILERINPTIRIYRDTQYRVATGHGAFMWLPTALVRAQDKGMLVDIVKQRDVADAKIAVLSRDEALY